MRFMFPNVEVSYAQLLAHPLERFVMLLLCYKDNV